MSKHTQVLVADPDGMWVKSKAIYPLIDPNTLTRFEGGVSVKAKLTAWLQMQVDARIFDLVDDPLAPAPAPAPAAESPVDESPPETEEKAEA